MSTIFIHIIIFRENYENKKMEKVEDRKMCS